MNKTLILLGVIILIALGVYFAFGRTNLTANSGTTRVTSAESYVFDNPIKTPHYISNIPEHKSVLPAPPINVALEFNFDLSAKSAISVTRDGTEYASGSTSIDKGNLVMRRALQTNLPDGLYTVKYTACWPDNSCHNGQFQFAVDPSQIEGYTDMTGRSQVQIDIQNYTFATPRIMVSPNTEITWVNKDADDHSINTDPHPGHYYSSTHNSRLLKQNDTYKLTLTQAGYYPYHCSPHASRMKGAIVVKR